MTLRTRGTVRRLLCAASILVALALAGCGGSSSSSSGNTPANTPANEPGAGAIPQNNEGDHDSDNNGGPSDGDGAR
jgi:ABC-type phosphate/phosphonate transport system substrate-binding protein